MVMNELDRIDALVDQALTALDRGEPLPSLEHLSGTERVEAEQVFRLLRTCWGAGRLEIPVLADDPIAQELGLVERPR